jgi:integrase
MSKVFRKIITRYRLPDGRVVPKGTPGAEKVVEKSAKWYGRVPGRSKLEPLCTNRGAAEQMLNKLCREAALAGVGIVDKYAPHRDRPLAGHFADWKSDLLARGDTADHVGQITSRAGWVITHCGFTRIGHLSEPVVWSALAHLRGHLGRSEQTCNHYLRAIKQFARWLVKSKRMAENPLDNLSARNVQTDRRHDHADLCPDELGAVLGAAQRSTRTFRGLTGVDRFHLYLAASRTGFRCQELASLTPQSFELDAQPPVANLAARFSKNRCPARQPLPPDLVEAMRGYLKGRPDRAPIWSGTWWRRGAEMLRIDLKAAGIAYEVERADGMAYRDFHGLRHAYITSLERAGVSVKTAQELARHGDVRLTLNLYTHKTLFDLGAAVEQLPPVPFVACPVACPGGRQAEGERGREKTAHDTTAVNTFV